jgi:hypothetical protein
VNQRRAVEKFNHGGEANGAAILSARHARRKQQ